VGTVIVALLALVLVIALVAVLAGRRGRSAAADPPVDPPDMATAAVAAESGTIADGVRAIEDPVPRLHRGPPLPVVLVHGLFGFDAVGVPGVKVHYFRGIVDYLASLGCQAHVVRLQRAAGVPERAQVLVDKITELGHERVDIIAHSLGGLDARYAIAKLGLASRVRSLVTIGTPHRGSPLADLADRGPLALARKAVAAIGVPLAAIDWLSTAALERFNRDVLDVPGVRYACVVGGLRDPSTPIALAIAPAHAYLRRIAGPNDGIVPMTSQYWGETLAEIEADHFEQVGWRLGIRQTFDAHAMYAFIVARLGDAPGAVAALADAAVPAPS
jgi:triacylglycerol lipase